MPHAVQGADPAGVVMPYSLASVFQRQEQWPVEENRYADGSVQNNGWTTTSRARFTITRKVTTAQLNALKAFFNARKGSTVEFIFYDVFETVPKFSYDNTGAAVAGQYVVRFDTPFQSTLGLPRHQASFSLIQVS